MSWLLIAMGLFSAAGGAMNWAFFMESRKAQGFVRLLGHTGTRIFYVVLGLVIAGLGVGTLIGVLPSN